MINTKIYQIKAELWSKNLDLHGRNKLEWVTIYAQVNNDKIEYSTDKIRAFHGDYDESIPHCTVSFLEAQKEQVAKLTEVTRRKDKKALILLIKQDEATPNDFQKV